MNFEKGNESILKQLFGISRLFWFPARIKVGDLSIQSSTTKVMFSIQALIEEIELPLPEKYEFEYQQK